MANKSRGKNISNKKRLSSKDRAEKTRQKETYEFTRKFYKFLKNHSSHIFFEKLYGNYVGKYDIETTDITIDHRRDFLSTLIHEYLHHVHPDWSETKVLNQERKLINALSVRQVKNILKALAKVI